MKRILNVVMLWVAIISANTMTQLVNHYPENDPVARTVAFLLVALIILGCLVLRELSFSNTESKTDAAEEKK